MNIAFKKKINRRMRIFEHRIFSKSFGGKIRHSWTDITYRINKEKKMVHTYWERLIFFDGKT